MGIPVKPIDLSHGMDKAGQEPNGHTFSTVLQACARTKDLELGGKVHAETLDRGIPPDSPDFSSLVGIWKT